MRFRFALAGCFVSCSMMFAQMTIDPAVIRERLEKAEKTEKTAPAPIHVEIKFVPNLPKPAPLETFEAMPVGGPNAVAEGPILPLTIIPLEPVPVPLEPLPRPAPTTPPEVVPEPTPITLPKGPHAPPIRYAPSPPSPEAPSRWRFLGDLEPRPEALGSHWNTDEFLLWWIKAGPVPPLATRSRTSPVAALGGPNSSLVLGGESWSTSSHAGYRTSLGRGLGSSDEFGLEIVYFLLGTRTASGVVGSPWQASRDFIARPFRQPFVDAINPGGAENTIPVNLPGNVRGGLSAALSSRVTGTEVNAVASLVSTKQLMLEGSLGYRYFQFNEGLRVEQESFILAQNGLPSSWQGVVDQIDAHNQFHGGQLGLRGEYRTSSFFIDFNGKLALGTNTQSVRTSGQTLVATTGNPFPLLLPGGFLVQPSNTGRISRSPFAVLPEVTLRVGLYDGNRHRVFIGYNFMYLSDVARPGDQIDRTINLNQLQAARVGVPLIGAERPVFAINSSDVWVQGLILGFESRY